MNLLCASSAFAIRLCGTERKANGKLLNQFSKRFGKSIMLVCLFAELIGYEEIPLPGANNCSSRTAI